MWLECLIEIFKVFAAVTTSLLGVACGQPTFVPKQTIILQCKHVKADTASISLL